MPGPWYVDRDSLKKALSIPTSTTGDHDALDFVLESVCRLIDGYVGYGLFPVSGTADYTPDAATCLDLGTPLLSVDSITLDLDANSSYETTMSTTCVSLYPYNAQTETPPRPYWALEVRPNATMVFPRGVHRGVRITGTWGYFNETVTTTAVLSTGVTSAAATLEITGASSLRAGMTLLIDSERLFVTRGVTSSTGANTSTIGVLRGQTGTAAATHSSGATIQVYTYPLVDAVAKFQAQQDYRAKDAPLGFAGGEPFGIQRPNPVAIGLHPFAARALDNIFRARTAI